MQTSRADPAEWTTPWPGASVTYRDVTSSTMDDARLLADAGCPAGTVAAAGRQEKGRGRVPGREWISVPGEALAATVVLRIPRMGFPLSELTLRAGLAAARAIEETAGVSVQVKWPNDVLAPVPGAAEPRKVAGILCEARGDTALVGLGVNCGQKEFPPEIEATAGSLLQACGRVIAPQAVLAAALRHLKDSGADLAWKDALNSRLYGRGGTVRVQLIGSGRFVEGILEGVGDEGGLVLRLSGGRLETVPQGELRSSP